MVLFVAKNFVHFRRAIDRHAMTDDETGIDLATFDAFEQRTHIAHHVQNLGIGMTGLLYSGFDCHCRTLGKFSKRLERGGTRMQAARKFFHPRLLVEEEKICLSTAVEPD